jgi:hypothetical protein
MLGLVSEVTSYSCRGSDHLMSCFCYLCSGQGHGQGSQGPLQGAFPNLLACFGSLFHCELIASSLLSCTFDVIGGELSQLL